MDMRHLKRQGWSRYGVAVLSVVGAALLTSAIAPLFTYRAPVIPFTLAVMLSAWYGGLGPGLVATILGFLAVDYLFLPPIHSLFPIRTEDYVLLALYTIVGVSISILTGKLSQSKEDSEAILATITDGVALIRDGKFIAVNAAFAALHGFDTPKEIPKTVEEFAASFEITLPDGSALPPEQWPVRRALEGELVTDFEIHVRRRDTGKLWIGSYSATLSNKNRKSDGVVVTIRNITQRKRAELELSESNRNLEEFAYVVSHDLQSPLNTIGVFAQWLSKQYAGKLDSQADQYLEFIGIAIHRMKALIAGLLAHARVATASPKSALAIDCNEVVARTLVSLNADITRTGGIITSDSLPVISATDYEIEQLFQNLI